MFTGFQSSEWAVTIQTIVIARIPCRQPRSFSLTGEHSNFSMFFCGLNQFRYEFSAFAGFSQLRSSEFKFNRNTIARNILFQKRRNVLFCCWKETNLNSMKCKHCEKQRKHGYFILHCKNLDSIKMQIINVRFTMNIAWDEIKFVGYYSGKKGKHTRWKKTLTKKWRLLI